MNLFYLMGQVEASMTIKKIIVELWTKKVELYVIVVHSLFP